LSKKKLFFKALEILEENVTRGAIFLPVAFIQDFRTEGKACF